VKIPIRLAIAVGVWLAVSGAALGQSSDVRGLDFTSFLHLERGMTDGQVLSIAGEPDVLSDQGFIEQRGAIQTTGLERRALALRTYTYLPTDADPFTTTITLVGGQVTDIRRDQRF
jgi:hypothetical protein